MTTKRIWCVLQLQSPLYLVTNYSINNSSVAMFVELASRLLLTWLAASPLVTTSLAQATPGQPTHDHSQGVVACHELAAKFPSLVFGSNTSTYANQSALPWSETCLLSPSCVFLPHKAADVAGALPLIKRARSPFAVISVGHMPVPGASTSEGVLISLNQLSDYLLILFIFFKS